MSRSIDMHTHGNSAWDFRPSSEGFILRGPADAYQPGRREPEGRIVPIPSPSPRRREPLEGGIAERLASAWFELDSHACFVTDLDGRLLEANGAGRALVESGAVALHGDGAMSFGLAEASEAVEEALRLLSFGQMQRKHIVLQGFDGVWRSLELHLHREGRSLVFITVRSEARCNAVSTQPLVEAFHLTPTQAEVLAKLASGVVPKDIGRRMGISTHTVRTHLRAIFAKLRVRGIAGTLRLTALLLH